MTSLPRPGSSIDRAMRALQASGPLPRAELARLIEQEEEEVDGLLRYGLRMGLLVRSNGDEDVSYALGNGVPVEDRPPACEAPAAPMAQAASDPAREASRPPPGQTAPAELRQGNYHPQPGSQAAILLAYLQQHAPHGSSVWLSAAELAACGADQRSVQPNLMAALKHGAAITTKVVGSPRMYQAGPAAPVVAERSPVSAPTAPDPAPATEVAEFLLAQLDGEIARLEQNLRLVRRRKENFAEAMKGPRSSPPQGALRNGGASVGFRTEIAQGSSA
jgi:hypothetical protein